MFLILSFFSDTCFSSFIFSTIIFFFSSIRMLFLFLKFLTDSSRLSVLLFNLKISFSFDFMFLFAAFTSFFKISNSLFKFLESPFKVLFSVSLSLTFSSSFWFSLLIIFFSLRASSSSFLAFSSFMLRS